MNKTKRLLTIAFSPPVPKRKDQFLQTYMLQKNLSLFKFIMIQASYIRKRIWILSGLVFLFALFISHYTVNAALLAVSGILPLLAVAMVTESNRSYAYAMAELEMACRFSLKAVILARRVILGLLNILLLCILSPVCSTGEVSMLRTGLYLLTPYMLSAISNLCIVRKYKSREATYGCIAVGTAVSLSIELLKTYGFDIYADKYLPQWTGIFLLLCAAAVFQSVKFLKNTEDCYGTNC